MATGRETTTYTEVADPEGSATYALKCGRYVSAVQRTLCEIGSSGFLRNLQRFIRRTQRELDGHAVRADEASHRLLVRVPRRCRVADLPRETGLSAIFP